jgi:hypothetical protein
MYGGVTDICRLVAILPIKRTRKTMNILSLKILPSTKSNDNEVRILIDNEDFLGEDYLGLDPSVFFDQTYFDKNGELTIGRCSCGCEGCCDFPVKVKVNENRTVWTDENGLNLTFDKEDYLNTVEIAKNDFSWEDTNRKMEHLTKNILKNSETKDNYKFQWAYARIKKNKITLSYSKIGDQKLYELSWDRQTGEDIEMKAKHFLNNKLKLKLPLKDKASLRSKNEYRSKC